MRRIYIYKHIYNIHLTENRSAKKVKKMESNNRKKKLSMTSALLVVAMISLVGVGFALEYTGTATTTTPSESGEYITVNVVKTDYNAGIYTVNTANRAGTVTLSGLKYWESKIDATADNVSEVSDKHFTYSGGAFTLVSGAPVEHGYASALIGTLSVNLAKPADAQSNKVTLVTSGAQVGSANEFGLSLVYTRTVGGGDETVIADPNGTLSNVDMAGTTLSVVIKAYVVYSTEVDVGAIGSISAFALTNTDVSFSATASYVAP